MCHKTVMCDVGKFLLLAVFAPSALAQEAGERYSAGTVIAAALIAFLAALVLVFAVCYIRRIYWRSRKGKHLVFSTDPESVKDEFAFDNPGFKEEKQWRHEAPTLPLTKTKADGKGDVSKDDSHLQRGRVRRVKLWARDFTGLGLRCSGGAREGVAVHSVLKNGPAVAANLHPGDKIKSIKIEFIGMPLEDAVGIMSLASPYPVELEVVEGGRISGVGKDIIHPLALQRRAGSMTDVNTLEKEGKHLRSRSSSPNATHSNNSTLDTKQNKGGIKKIITDKILGSTSLERNKKEKVNSNPSTLDRDNDKNAVNNKARHSEIIAALSKPDKNKQRFSTGSDIAFIENGRVEQAAVQKKENDTKRGTKFGIRVLPPNVPDDGVLKQKFVENGVVSTENNGIDTPDKPEIQIRTTTTVVRSESETESKKPVVAKRREKMAPPIPNVRNKTNDSDTNNDVSYASESTVSFDRSSFNSSGIRRDENGIPQELPQHLFDAAKAAKTNRKSLTEFISDDVNDEVKQDDPPKSIKKSKGKAPSPPARNKLTDSISEQRENISDFLKNEKHHSTVLNNTTLTSNNTDLSFNASTPKVNKGKSVTKIDESINFSQDDIDDIVSKPFRRESDSLNNYFEDTKSNLSFNQDGHSTLSLNNSEKSDKMSTTIELNNSDITIHSTPTNDPAASLSDETSVVDDNERKAASLGDLSRFELKPKSSKSSNGTLERAQSLDISADEEVANKSTLSPSKNKGTSPGDTVFVDSKTKDMLPNKIENISIAKQKELRHSLDITKSLAIENLTTFQQNRLKKASEFGNLEDAIVKSSNSSIESDNSENTRHVARSLETPAEPHETSDHLAKRIMDENMKIHFKLVSEFAKTTSDSSGTSSLSSNNKDKSVKPIKTDNKVIKNDEVNLTYGTNLPDDIKASRNSYVNSLERPKSEMMKKLLAINPILNAHVDNIAQNKKTSEETPTPMTDASKSAIHQPDIVNFNLKSAEPKSKHYEDFVSNIRVGSNNTSLNYDKSFTDNTKEWTDSANDYSSNNIVTITTNDKTLSPQPTKLKTFMKSIEVGEPTIRLIPDIVDDINKRKEENESRTLYMEPANMSITMTQEPIKKTVTVNVTEDEFGNKVITQNVETVSKNLTNNAEIPLQVEQISFGIMKDTGEIDEFSLEKGDVPDIDKSFINRIKQQNPDLYLTSEDPAYTRTETIILKTELDEAQAKILLDRLKNDPKFMANKSPEELSQMGIKIIRDLEDDEIVSNDAMNITKTRYSINTPTFTPAHQENDKTDHITEIQVSTSQSEKYMPQKAETKYKASNRQRKPSTEEPFLSYELDVEVINDFISNERHHSAKHFPTTKKPTKSNETKKRHADHTSPRNSPIKFQTGTYESPKYKIITSTEVESKRLSELEQMQVRGILDPSQINQKYETSSQLDSSSAKYLEKPKQVSSKIPVFMTQKSLSQDSLFDKQVSLPRVSPPKVTNSSGNISITSIKSGSKSPSGGNI